MKNVHTSRKRPVQAVVTIAVAVLLYWLPTLVDPSINGVLHAAGLLGAGAQSFKDLFLTGQAVRWLCVILLLLYVPLVEREPLSSIGIRMPRLADIWLALAAVAVVIVVGGGLYLLARGLLGTAGSAGASSTQSAQIDVMTVPVRLETALNAGVFEELIFRSVLIERMLWLTRRRWIPAVVSVVVFAGSHYLTGSQTLLYTVTVDAVAGIGFVALYLLRRNVIASALAHFITDIVGLIGLG